MIFFDAVGTLIESTPSVIETYRNVALESGTSIPAALIQERLAEAIQCERSIGETDEQRERERWRRIVGFTLAECPDVEAVFESLWNRFAQPEQWRLFSDAATCLEALSKNGRAFAIASNFDQRLNGLCRQIPPLDRASHIFHSANLGFAKPHRDFFRAIESRTGLEPEACLLVGDDIENDYHGALMAGWRAVQIDRTKPTNLTENRLNSLVVLPQWLSRQTE